MAGSGVFWTAASRRGAGRPPGERHRSRRSSPPDSRSKSGRQRRRPTRRRKIKRDRVVDDARVPAGADDQPSTPQISSSQACISSSWLPSPSAAPRSAPAPETPLGLALRPHRCLCHAALVHVSFRKHTMARPELSRADRRVRRLFNSGIEGRPKASRSPSGCRRHSALRLDLGGAAGKVALAGGGSMA